MDTPSTLNDALDALAAARADLGALNALSAEHAALVGHHETLTANYASLEKALAASVQRISELEAQLAAKSQAETDAAARANAIVANLGVPPVTIQSEQATQPKTKAELWAHYQTLGFTERNSFYREHKAVMSGR
jgi:hypothetical protein